MSDQESFQGPVKPYGVAIRDAAASGDETRIRQVAEHARRWLAENPGHENHGEVQAELRKLDESRGS